MRRSTQMRLQRHFRRASKDAGVELEIYAMMVREGATDEATAGTKSPRKIWPLSPHRVRLEAYTPPRNQSAEGGVQGEIPDYIAYLPLEAVRAMRGKPEVWVMWCGKRYDLTATPAPDGLNPIFAQVGLKGAR